MTDYPDGTRYGIHTIDNIDVVKLIEEITEIILIKVIEEVTLLKTIETIGSMPDFTPRGSEGVAFRQKAGIGAGWVSPTGHEDASGHWKNEANAYDENTGTMAATSADALDYGWCGFLILTLAAPIRCNKIRYFVGADPPMDGQEGRKIDIDVYRDGAWEHVAEITNYTEDAWAEVKFSEGLCEKYRIRFHGLATDKIAYIYETDIYQSATSGGELIVHGEQSDETLNKVTVYQPTAANLKAEIVEIEQGTRATFNIAATTDLVSPALGEHVTVHSAFYYCTTDIITELRFKATGNVVLGLPTLGAIGMRHMHKQTGGDTEKVELYMSGAGNVKGWILYTKAIP